jgi:hypothetical protein
MAEIEVKVSYRRQSLQKRNNWQAQFVGPRPTQKLGRIRRDNLITIL